MGCAEEGPDTMARGEDRVAPSFPELPHRSRERVPDRHRGLEQRVVEHE